LDLFGGASFRLRLLSSIATSEPGSVFLELR
jgi:hypothetical protein